MSLFQREQHEMLAGIGVGYVKSGSLRMNYVMPSAKLYIHRNLQRHRTVSPRQQGFLVLVLSFGVIVGTL